MDWKIYYLDQAGMKRYELSGFHIYAVRTKQYCQFAADSARSFADSLAKDQLVSVSTEPGKSPKVRAYAGFHVSILR